MHVVLVEFSFLPIRIGLGQVVAMKKGVARFVECHNGWAKDTMSTSSILWRAWRRPAQRMRFLSPFSRNLPKNAGLSSVTAFREDTRSLALPSGKWWSMTLDPWLPVMIKSIYAILAMVAKQSGSDLETPCAISIAAVSGWACWFAQTCATLNCLVNLLWVAAATSCCSQQLLPEMSHMQVGNPLWSAELWKTKCHQPNHSMSKLFFCVSCFIFLNSDCFIVLLLLLIQNPTDQFFELVLCQVLGSRELRRSQLWWLHVVPPLGWWQRSGHLSTWAPGCEILRNFWDHFWTSNHVMTTCGRPKSLGSKDWRDGCGAWGQ